MNRNFNYSFLDMESLRMSSAMFGRMFATGAYYICLQYASEIFPTSIRGSGLSLCEIIGGIGLFMSPWIVYLVSILLRIERSGIFKCISFCIYKIFHPSSNFSHSRQNSKRNFLSLFLEQLAYSDLWRHFSCRKLAIKIFLAI